MQIAVLGPLRLVDDGVELALPGRRQRTLVCRLAVAANELVPAAALVEDLWDGAPTPGAASTLQSHVSAVRKVLGADRILSQAGGYRLVVEEVDARQVTALTAMARDAARADDWNRVGQVVSAALALYRGEPLVDAAGALWARGEVSRLSELRLELRELGVDALLVAGDQAAAVAEAEAMLADEPLRERVWGQLMVALHRSGRRAEALRAYQRLHRSLGDELGLTPSPALVALETAIATDDPALATGLPWAPQRPPASPRSPEVDAGTDGGGAIVRREGAAGAAGVPSSEVDAGSDGGGAIVRREGAAGAAGVPSAEVDDGSSGTGAIGRREGDDAELPTSFELPPILRDAADAPTVGRAGQRRTLDEAFTALAGGRGGTVLVTGEGGIGKTTLIAQAVRARPDVTVLYGRCLADGELYYQPFVDALGDELARLGRRVGGTGHDPTGDTTVDRSLLFQGVEQVLVALAARRPLALVVDDLHWADGGTVALVRHLVDRVADEPLLLVVAVRAVDLDPDGPAGALLADLHRARRLVRVDLDGLGVDDIAELATHFGSPPEVAERLASLTAGNPYFVAELLRHGWLGLDGGEPLPATVSDMVRRRAGAAGADVARLLAGAAVIGPTFDAALVAEVTERAPGEVLDALDQAIDRGLVVEQEQPGGATSLAFAHALAGAALAGTLSAGRRRALHRRCALALGRRRRVPPAAVAQHWLSGYEADDGPVVVDALRRAGDDALAQLVPTEALAWFDRAVEVADDVDLTEAERARLLVGRAQALFELNDAGAGPAIRDAVAAAAASGDAELLAAAALTGSRGFASSLRPARVHRAALLEQAVDAQPSSPMRSRLLADLATELMMVDAARASALAREAIDLAVAAGSDADQLHALKRAAAVGSPLVADWIWPMLDRAAALAERLDDRHSAWELAVCTRLLAVVRGDRARLDVAAAAVAAPGPLGELPRVRFAVALDRARVAVVDGRPLEAMAAVADLAAIGDEHRLPDAATFRDIYGGAALRQLGERRGWEPLAPYQSFDAATAVALVDLGDVEGAAERLDVAVGGRPLAGLPMSNFWLSFVGCTGYAAARLGRADLAGEAAALLEPHAHRTDELVGPISHVVGLCARIVAPDDATGWLTRAKASAEAQHLGFASALIALDLADDASAAGDGRAAADLAGEALVLSNERGFAGLARRAGALLAA